MEIKVVVHGKPFSPEDKTKLELFFNKLSTSGFIPILSESFAEMCIGMGVENSNEFKTYNKYDNFIEVKFGFSFGGDGTLLELLTHIGSYEIPIIGVNMGRLGFLATTSMEEVNFAIDYLVKDEYEIDERILLHMDSNLNSFEDKNFALNDFAILKRDTSSMIKVKVLLDGIYLNTYWADGLIVSTPTGSTGYSLSCGGPLVLPQSNNFVITPVSPHNLNARPLVVSDYSEISFEIEARSGNVLISLDSRSMSVPTDIQIKITKHNKSGKLVKFNDYNQLDTMRTKLNWGVDYRN
jgi:NAD+ kinase